MSSYRRLRVPGGTYFFTAVAEARNLILIADLARPILRQAIADALSRRPAEVLATVLLPDHFHTMWTLPEGDDDFPTQWADLKSGFTREWLKAGGDELAISHSRQRHRRRGVWQRHFWEHLVRRRHDGRDFENHVDYMHYNPVKHGLVKCPHLWPWSTFPKWVANGTYPPEWMCVCDGRTPEPPDFSWADELELE